MDPLLLMELLEVHPDWEVRRLADDKGIFIGSDNDFTRMLEALEDEDWDEDTL